MRAQTAASVPRASAGVAFCRSCLELASDAPKRCFLTHLKALPMRARRFPCRWDLVAERRSDSLQSLEQALNTIRASPGSANTETNLLLSTHAA